MNKRRDRDTDKKIDVDNDIKYGSRKRESS